MKIKEPHKLPPMAATIRVIMPKIQYPPFRKETKDSKGKRNHDGCSGDNLAYTAIIQAMLHHAKGIKADAATITINPALQQIADVCQVSRSTIKRYLAELKEYGTVTAVEHGSDISSDFTIHIGHLDSSPSEPSKGTDQTVHQPSPDGSPTVLDGSPSVLDGSPSEPLRSKPSGVIPQDKTAQEKTKPSSSISSNSTVAEVLNDGSTASKEAVGTSPPPKSHKTASTIGTYPKRKRLTPEMEALPLVIEWRAAKKNREAWDMELRRIGFKGQKEDGYKEYKEALNAVNYWDEEWIRLDRLVAAMLEGSR